MKLVTLLLLSFFSLSAFSQSCYVDLIVRNSGRVLRSFQGWGDPSCLEGMKECRKAIRLQYSNSPQFPNGSLDCVRSGFNQPGPQIPSTTRLEINSLSLDMARNVESIRNSAEIIETVLAYSRSYELQRLPQWCSSSYTWVERYNCLSSGVRSASRELIDEVTAKKAIVDGCSRAFNGYNQRRCFESASFSRFNNIQRQFDSCRWIGDHDASSRCYRQIFERW
jgi:hypothetical protein